METITDGEIPARIMSKKQTLTNLIKSAQKSKNVAFRVFTLRFAARFFSSLGDTHTVHELLTLAYNICPREIPDFKKLQADMKRFCIQTKIKPVKRSIPVQHFDLANSISDSAFRFIKQANLSVWILFKSGAVLCCHHNDEVVNTDLISAFFIALQNFSTEYGDGPLQSLILKQFRYEFIESADKPISIICRCPAHFDQEEIRPILIKIYDEFWRRFEPLFQEGFTGNVGFFRGFFD